MKKIRDEAEVWADGYGFVEFRRTGTGLVPYHHETRSPSSPTDSVVSRNDKLTARKARYLFLA